MAFTDRLANRGSISTGYDIEYSMFLGGANCEGEITQTGGDRKTHTISFWFKRAPIGWSTSAGHINGTSEDMWGTSSEGDTLRFNGSRLAFFQEGGTGGQIYTTAVFRDVSAWYHLVIAVDTTQGTAANRLKMYVNGVQQTTFDTEDYPDQNAEFKLMQSGQVFRIGAGHGGSTSATGQGYYSEFIIVDGAAKAASDFGEFHSTSGIWVPKEYTGDFNTGSGTNGAYYKFEGTAEGTGAGSTGLDSSGESNNMNFENQNGGLVDTPTNNFCVLNSRFRGQDNTDKAVTHGGTHIPADGFNQSSQHQGSIGVTKGKWYWETYIDSRSASYGLDIYTGAHTFQGNYQGNTLFNSSGAENPALWHLHGGNFYTYDSGSRDTEAGIAAAGASEVGEFIGVALNLDDNQISYYLDGSAVTGGTDLALNDLGDDADAGIFVLPALSVYDNDHTVNFGGFTKASISSAQTDENGYGTFEHSPPSGYYALCTKNLAEYG